METTRFLLIISLGLVLTMIWQAWVKDYGHLDTQYKTKTTVEQKEENEIVIQETTTPTLNIEENISPRPTNDTEATPFEKIKVTTDVFDLAINPQGGTIECAALKKYPVSKKNQTKPSKNAVLC